MPQPRQVQGCRQVHEEGIEEMNCGSKGMKKGGKVSADMISPRKAMAMGMSAGSKKPAKKGMKKGMK